MIAAPQSLHSTSPSPGSDRSQGRRSRRRNGRADHAAPLPPPTPEVPMSMPENPRQGARTTLRSLFRVSQQDARSPQRSTGRDGLRHSGTRSDSCGPAPPAGRCGMPPPRPLPVANSRTEPSLPGPQGMRARLADENRARPTHIPQSHPPNHRPKNILERLERLAHRPSG